MTTKQCAELYQRAGMRAPDDIAAPSAEYIRNTKRKLVDGIEFRSTLEATAYQALSLWQKAGAITDLSLQPHFVLQPKFTREGKTIRAITYKADFRFLRDGKPVVVEVKGFKTQPYLIRRKLFLAKFPAVTFEEWTRATIKALL